MTWLTISVRFFYFANANIVSEENYDFFLMMKSIYPISFSLSQCNSRGRVHQCSSQNTCSSCSRTYRHSLVYDNKLFGTDTCRRWPFIFSCSCCSTLSVIEQFIREIFRVANACKLIGQVLRVW